MFFCIERSTAEPNVFVFMSFMQSCYINGYFEFDVCVWGVHFVRALGLRPSHLYGGCENPFRVNDFEVRRAEPFIEAGKISRRSTAVALARVSISGVQVLA